MNRILICLLLFVVSTSFAVASKQRIAVTGRLTCHGKPYSGAKVKMYDRDTFSLDDLLDSNTSNKDGSFSLLGAGREITTMRSHVNIYHRCGKTLPVCYYKITKDVPNSVINSGKMYDFQTIELSSYPANRDCLN